MHEACWRGRERIHEAGGRPAVEFQLSKEFRPVVIERWLRVCGDSLRRITETETAWWHNEVMTPLLEVLPGARGDAGDVAR